MNNILDKTINRSISNSCHWFTFLQHQKIKGNSSSNCERKKKWRKPSSPHHVAYGAPQVYMITYVPGQCNIVVKDSFNNFLVGRVQGWFRQEGALSHHLYCTSQFRIHVVSLEPVWNNQIWINSLIKMAIFYYADENLCMEK